MATSSTGNGRSTGDRDSPDTPRWSDRLLGLVCVVVAVWYTVAARTYDTTAFEAGPVGPKTLPTGIGILFGALAVYLIVQPDRSPRWPTLQAAWQVAVVLVSSYVYGRILEPTGFIFASAVMTIIIGLLFRAPVRKLIPLSAAFPIALAYVFNNWLDLRLPAGWWGGL